MSLFFGVRADELNITSTFGMRVHPVTGERKMHEGVDIAIPLGTPVLALADGVVEYESWDSPTAGIWLRYRVGERMRVSIMHLSGIAEHGGVARKGVPLGWSGNTGLSTGPHLHLEIAIDGRKVDPLPILRSQDPGIWERFRSYVVSAPQAPRKTPPPRAADAHIIPEPPRRAEDPGETGEPVDEVSREEAYVPPKRATADDFRRLILRGGD